MAEVARRAGFRERTFNQYLTRGSEPKFVGLLRICDALVTHPNYLLGHRRSRTAAEAR
jgi:DNA-binding phage protein